MRTERLSWKNKKSLIIVLLFTLLSIAFISAETEKIESNFRSTQLLKNVIKDENTERTDYLDSEGKITVAADAGYATRIKTKTEKGILEKYFDENGEPVKRNSGYYAVLREYDENGNNIRNTYMDLEGNPCDTKDGYAVEERKYNNKNELLCIRYYDTDGKPALSASFGFGSINEYDENGHNIMTTYIDEQGNPMLTKQGYASIIRQFYTDDGPDRGRVKNEFYFDEQGEPVALSLGQYGLYKEYNELGQGIVLTYLNAEGKPIVTKKGYTTVIRTFKADNNVVTQQYYDVEGNPFSLSEGQYGVKNENGLTVYLDENGNEQFNVKNLLYNQSVLIIPVVLLIIMLAAVFNRNWNMVFAVGYIIAIAYLTLMFRENEGAKLRLEPFWSYKKLFTDSEIRADIIKNIWLFIPLGAILYRIYPNTRVLLIPVGLSILVEAIQYFDGIGLCELDDVISNGLGGVIGYGMGCQVKKIRDLILCERNKRMQVAND